MKKETDKNVKKLRRYIITMMKEKKKNEMMEKGKYLIKDGNDGNKRNGKSRKKATKKSKNEKIWK